MPLQPTLLPLLALVVLAAGCDLNLLGLGTSVDEVPGELTELPRSLTAHEVELLEGSNAFAWDLLGEILQSRPEESHLISPLSASMALGMALNGAGGETLEAMRSTLRFDGLSDAQVNASFQGLMELLGGLDPQVSFGVGNSVWYARRFTLRSSFREAVEGPYQARVEGVNFGDPATPGILNAWVDERTRGRIPEIVPDPLPGEVVLYLLNAIHFQGDWRHRFDPGETVDGDFHLPDGSTAPARFMTDRRTVEYVHDAHGGAYRAVDLPYGRGAFSMTVVVPRGGHSVQDIVGTLAEEGWAEMIEGLSPRNDVELHLPRFTFEWGGDEDGGSGSLDAPLQALGMDIAFSDAADFSRLFEHLSPGMTAVRHKTFIRVDEEGTEAAAAAAVEFGISGSPVVRADRPFLYAIRERLSGTILFLGVMMEPPTG